MTCAPRSAAGTFAMDPPNLPTAVRSAAVMTTSFIQPPKKSDVSMPANRVHCSDYPLLLQYALHYFCNTYSPGASPSGAYPAATDPIGGGLTLTGAECCASHSAHVGHHDPDRGGVPSNHASGESVSLAFNHVRTRWRRRACTAPLMIPAL